MIAIHSTTSKAATRLLKFFGKNGEKWTHHAYAQDKNGQTVMSKSRNAVKWCLAGAIDKLRMSPAVYSQFNDIINEKASIGVVTFNDSHRTYTHVRKFLERVAGK